MHNSQRICAECNRPRERCRAITVNRNGDVEYVCRQCWARLDYNTYLYKHNKFGYSEAADIAEHRQRQVEGVQSDGKSSS